MSRAETLAGLAEALAEHRRIGYRGVGVACACGWTIYATNGWNGAHAAHVAAVALAWLEGHGWTEGTEEWGTRDRNGHVRTHMFKPSAERLAEIDHREVVRRRVSAWAPVETGEDA